MGKKERLRPSEQCLQSLTVCVSGVGMGCHPGGEGCGESSIFEEGDSVSVRQEL